MCDALFLLYVDIPLSCCCLYGNDHRNYKRHIWEDKQTCETATRKETMLKFYKYDDSSTLLYGQKMLVKFKQWKSNF